MPDNNILLTIVVNGTPAQVEANVNAPLRTVIARALAQTQNTGRPPEDWELRDAQGILLDITKKVGEFNFPEGTTLFLNLTAGVAGVIRK